MTESTRHKLSKTHLSVLIAYSSPFILVTALGINLWLTATGLAQSSFKLPILSMSFPIGLSIGRYIYRRKSHIEILFDQTQFILKRGSREVARGSWKSYKSVSIRLDHYGRPTLRLYKLSNGEYVDIPVFQSGVSPQELRDYVQELIKSRGRRRVTLQAVEAS